jgi:hypothetical protein
MELLELTKLASLVVTLVVVHDRQERRMVAIKSILRRRPVPHPPLITNRDFEDIGLEIVLGPYHTCAAKGERLRKFESFFGAEPFYVAILWFELQESG